MPSDSDHLGQNLARPACMIKTGHGALFVAKSRAHLGDSRVVAIDPACRTSQVGPSIGSGPPGLRVDVNDGEASPPTCERL